MSMDKVLQIMKSAIEITQDKENPAQVFVEYMGHIEVLEVRIFNTGWIEYKDPASSYWVNLNRNDSDVHLDNIISALNLLKEVK